LSKGINVEIKLLGWILTLIFIWAGPSALLSAWFMRRYAKEGVLKGFLGSLAVITGFIFAVIEANELSLKNDTIMILLLLAYFPLAGIVWGRIEHLMRHELPRAQLLAKLAFPALGAIIVGAVEILGVMMFPFSFVLWVFTMATPGSYWLIARLILKMTLGVDLGENIKFELILMVIGFVSGELTYFLLLLPSHLIMSEIWRLSLALTVPYILIGLIDAIFNFKLTGNSTELSLEKRAILVTVPLYLSLAFVGYTLVAWDMLAHSGA
jgi:hypothetical protein